MVAYIQDLIKKAQDGDNESLDKLINYYMPLIKSVAYKFSRNYKLPSSSDDLIQDAKVLFIEFVKNYEPQTSNFGYYLKKNFERSFNSKYSKYYLDKSNYNTLPLYHTNEAPDIFSRINMVNDLARALQSLPVKQQIAIKLYYFADLPQEDCAKYMDMQQSAFSRLLGRARKNMKKTLSM